MCFERILYVIVSFWDTYEKQVEEGLIAFRPVYLLAPREFTYTTAPPAEFP